MRTDASRQKKMIPLPEDLPPGTPPLDMARAWAAIGNVSFANCWLDQTPGVTDEIVMELRRLADGKCLHPERIGRLREPGKFMERRMREPDWQSDGGAIRLYLGDCLDLLPTIPAGAVDAVVTDVPYGIAATTMTLGKGKKEFHRGAWDGERINLKPLMAIGTHHAVWGGNYYTDALPPTNRWLIWHKLNDDRSFSEVEMCWTDFAPQARHLSHHWGGEEKEHPTQKPLRVMAWTLEWLPLNASVIDPYMGSGTTGAACVRAGRPFIGIEREPRYFDIAVRRIKAELAQPRLFTAPEPVHEQGEMFQ